MLILLLHLKLARRVINLSSQVISSITQINAKSFRGNIQLLGTGSKNSILISFHSYGKDPDHLIFLTGISFFC